MCARTYIQLHLAGTKSVKLVERELYFGRHCDEEWCEEVLGFINVR